MGYYIRVLSTFDERISIEYLRDELSKNKLKAKLTCEAGVESEWEQLLLAHGNDTAIALIERNCVQPESLGEAELNEFISEMSSYKPKSAATWLENYLKSVRCIYSFQLVSGTDYKNGWEILACIKNAIWRLRPSILQADNEGFTNEDGYHILWQFEDHVEGDWNMGVLKDGKWVHFKMNLGKEEHRKAFLDGNVPSGISAD